MARPSLRNVAVDHGPTVTRMFAAFNGRNLDDWMADATEDVEVESRFSSAGHRPEFEAACKGEPTRAALALAGVRGERPGGERSHDYSGPSSEARRRAWYPLGTRRGSQAPLGT